MANSGRNMSGCIIIYSLLNIIKLMEIYSYVKVNK
jgi:hypothetical protein